jgi:rhodanese-related sulfurtransferase
MPFDEGDELVSVDELLAAARSTIERLTPDEAFAAIERGAALIDIRPADQRERDGSLPDAHVIPRNVLEWRLDPRSEHCDPALARRDVQLIVICDEGYQSSLVAATLCRFGLDATDVVGGFQSWRSQGLRLSQAADS